MTLTDLNGVTFVDADEEAIKQELLALYTKLTGRTLSPGDPVRLFLLTIAAIITQQRAYINATGRQNLLKYAEGDNLEQLGILVGVERLAATAAATTVKITLSAARTSATTIPAGTRITAGDNVFFAIEKAVVIPSGETTATASAACTETGTVGNGYLAGELSTIVDPVPFVASIVNTTASEGGSEIESDDSYREAIRSAPEGFSNAGSQDAYEYYAKRASALITDVDVSSPEAGEVEIRPLLEDGKIPGEEILADVLSACNDRTVRPLTDKVTVLAPTAKSYDVNVTYYIGRDDADQTVSIGEAVTAAVDDFTAWQREKLGRDINPSRLIQKMVAAGAKRVEVTAPVFTKVENTAVAVQNTVTVKYGGVEDE